MNGTDKYSFVHPIANIYQMAMEHPDAPAIIEDDRTYSYRDLWQDIRDTASFMNQYQLNSGDVVAFLSENSYQLIVYLLACWQKSIVTLILNTRSPESQIIQILEEVNPACTFVSSSMNYKGLLSHEQVHLMALPGSTDKSENRDVINIDHHSPATMILTSGSTGHPKIVVHSYHNHIASAIGILSYLNIEPGSSWMLALPLFHAGGLAILFRMFISGGTVIIHPAANKLEETLYKTQPHYISLVGTQLWRLLQSDSGIQALRMCRGILLGGSAIPESLINRCIGLDIPIYPGYGSSEMASTITVARKKDKNLTTSGKVIPYREITIDDESQILVRGETLFLGYFHKGTIKRPKLPGDGWFATGDLGKIDEHGNLIVLGRKDHMFISGGENIYPEQIENVIKTLDFIEEAIVIPMPDPEFGQRPCLFIQAGLTVDEQIKSRILNYIRLHLPSYMVPADIRLIPESMQNQGIKISRHLLHQYLKSSL
ncbi:MAG: o-succinylbenzoate--CoA ligase [Calditrichia bacterium]